MAITAIDRAGARGGIGDALATLAGALLLFVAVVSSLIIGADVVGRYLVGRPLLGGEAVQGIETYFGIGFAAIPLLALPAALSAGFARRGDPPLRSRSALALVPGCLLGVAAAILGVLLLVFVMELEPGRAVSHAVSGLASTFSSYVFLFVPISIALAAALGGARTPEATAAAAAPTILIWLVGYFLQASIAEVMAALFLPLLLLAVGFAVLYIAAPAQAVTPLLLGTVPPLVMALPMAIGILTPTEAVAVVAIVGLAVALPVRVVAFGHPLAPMLRQLAMELAAIVTVIAAATLLSQPLAYAGVTGDVVEALATISLVLPIGAVAFFAASYFLTPAFTLAILGLVLMPTIEKAGANPIRAGAVLALIGLAAMLARSGHANAADGQSLPRLAAWIGASIAVGIAILIVLVPDIAVRLM